MNLILFPKSAELLDVAFRRARKQAAMLKSERSAVKDAKGRAITRIEASGNYAIELMKNTVKDFPSMQKIPAFYRELIETTIDADATLKALGHMSAGRRIIARLKGKSIGRIKGLNKSEAKNANAIAMEFYGRLGSIVKKLDHSIEKYNEAAKKMRELPEVNFELPTAIIAGYPNTGKSTLLGRITKSKPKVAAYPFTTQKLQIGYLIHNYNKVQLIDTPGLLDRPLEKRNPIERKAIAALKHLANEVIFVVDPTYQSGFSLESQKKLLEEIWELLSTPIIVVINKADAATEEELLAAKGLFPNALVEGEGIESGLKEKIVDALGKKI